MEEFDGLVNAGGALDIRVYLRLTAFSWIIRTGWFVRRLSAFIHGANISKTNDFDSLTCRQRHFWRMAGTWPYSLHNKKSPGLLKSRRLSVEAGQRCLSVLSARFI